MRLMKHVISTSFLLKKLGKKNRLRLIKTTAWEQRKLGDVAKRYDSKRVPVTASNRIPGSTPYYGANGVQDWVEGFTHHGEFVLLAEDGAADYSDYPVWLINGLSWINNHVHVISAKPQSTINEFLVYALKHADIGKSLVGGTRSKLTAKDMMKLRISLPSLSEQRFIGAFFHDFDDLITLRQRELRQIFQIIRV